MFILHRLALYSIYQEFFKYYYFFFFNRLLKNDWPDYLFVISIKDNIVSASTACGSSWTSNLLLLKKICSWIIKVSKLWQFYILHYFIIWWYTIRGFEYFVYQGDAVAAFDPLDRKLCWWQRKGEISWWLCFVKENATSEGKLPIPFLLPYFLSHTRLFFVPPCPPLFPSAFLFLFRPFSSSPNIILDYIANNPIQFASI